VGNREKYYKRERGTVNRAGGRNVTRKLQSRKNRSPAKRFETNALGGGKTKKTRKKHWGRPNELNRQQGKIDTPKVSNPLMLVAIGGKAKRKRQKKGRVMWRQARDATRGTKKEEGWTRQGIRSQIPVETEKSHFRKELFSTEGLEGIRERQGTEFFPGEESRKRKMPRG